MMIQTLPRIPRPHGAIAVVNQASISRQTPAPRGMDLDGTFVERRTQLVPKDSAADHLGVLLKGYLSTRTVMAAEVATEAPDMLKAENLELKHAATGVSAADGSLRPRPVAVTLLAYGTKNVHCNGARVYLDALAHLASTPLALMRGDGALTASLIRMTVFAGVDAEWFGRWVHKEALETEPQLKNATIDVAVRWAMPDGSIRTEFKAMHSGISLDKSLEAMQNNFLSMKMAYGTPFPDDISTVHANVPRDAWASSVHNASNAFFEFMEGKPCVFKGELLKQHEGEVNVEATDIFVRICPRNVRDNNTGEWALIPVHESRVRSDAFHALLIGNSAHQEQIAQYCRDHQVLGLPPNDFENGHFCLHTCAVQASGFNLGDRVSLYATHPRGGGRAPGVPISPPGSWIWRMEPAIVAIEHVMRDFYVIPCSRESVLPGDRVLERPFNQFFNRAYQLYTNTFGTYPQKRCDNDDFERMPLSLPARTPGADPAIAAAENYALTAFNLDASSRRIAVGDAYASLKARQAPQQMTELMLQSALRSGINMPILDAMGEAAQVLASMPQGSQSKQALQDEVCRLKRVADAALHINGKTRRTLAPAVEIGAHRVKALLSAAGLHKGGDVHLPHGKLTAEHYAKLVQTVGSCVLDRPASEESLKQACTAASKANGLLESMCAAICVLRATGRASPSPAFVVGQDTSRDGFVSFNRVLPSGGFEKTTPGNIVDARVSSVLLVKEGEHGLRVTATVRAE
jgi:hypothetical protein